MRSLSAEETIAQTKSLALVGSARCSDPRKLSGQRGVPATANLLYKPVWTPAASRCAKIRGHLAINFGWAPLRARPGPRTQAGRSPPQAEHDAAKRRTAQEICRRRCLDEQTGGCRNILCPEEVESEKLFRNRTVFHARIQFSVFSQQTRRVQRPFAASDRKFSVCLCKPECPRRPRRFAVWEKSSRSRVRREPAVSGRRQKSKIAQQAQ